MISIIGIGNTGAAIAKQFEKISNYNVYLIHSDAPKNSLSHYKLEEFSAPEDYETHIPDLRNFFKDVHGRVQVFVMGAAMSSSYTLGILEQIQDREIELFYIKPDIELLTGVPKLLENATFGILQEYARSGLFKSITLLSNLEMERVLGEVPIKTYYETLNNSIFSAVHYLNYFEFSDPEIGQVAKAADLNRIRTIGMLDVKKLEEKWLFELDTPREICYYICINEKRLVTEGGLHKKIVEQLKEKPKNAFRKISYAIYETEHEDFGFCVAHTNVVQEQKTFDSSS